jgi:hypothetical protein
MDMNINVYVINAILSAAWIAALIMMALADVLTRLVIIYLRGRRLAAGAPAPVAPLAGSVGA